MISTILTGSEHINITGGYVTTVYVSNWQEYAHARVAGAVRYNASHQCTEIFDGNAWTRLPSNAATVDLASDSKQALDWAKKKMQEEQQRQTLAENNPAFADLLNQFRELEQKVLMVEALIKT